MKILPKLFKEKWQWFNMLKMFVKILMTSVIACGILFCAMPENLTAQEVLQGSVVAVPNSMFGLWRVVSKRIDTDSPITFKEKGTDLWNLSSELNVIKISNPFSGAQAEIKVDSVNNKTVTFTKTSKSGNKTLVDKVTITIEEEAFEGVDELELQTISNVSGQIIKTETAKYNIYGEKIAGKSIL
jgi:hypothetical protein